MADILFIDLLRLSSDEQNHLKLIFNSDWDYKVAEQSKSMQAVFGKKDYHLDLLHLYGYGKADIVRESVRTHDPKPRVRRFKDGDNVFAFIPYGGNDWLLASVFRVVDSDKDIVDVDEKAMADYQKYVGRLVVTWEDRKTRNIRMTDMATISKLTVKTIFEKPYYETAMKFPGYKNVNLSFDELKEVLKLDTWRTALKNQRAVYLQTDTKTNKRYVGSATGDDGLLARWQNYVDTKHGGNSLLKKLPESYIVENFRYSILETFDSSTLPDEILNRESWWKKVLLSYSGEFKDGRVFGYNDNI